MSQNLQSTNIFEKSENILCRFFEEASWPDFWKKSRNFCKDHNLKILVQNWPEFHKKIWLFLFVDWWATGKSVKHIKTTRNDNKSFYWTSKNFFCNLFLTWLVPWWIFISTGKNVRSSFRQRLGDRHGWALAVDSALNVPRS